MAFKVKFNYSGHYANTTYSEVIDVEDVYDINEEQWHEMTEDDKNEIIEEWMWGSGLEMWSEPVS